MICAAGLFREIGYPFYLGMTVVEHCGLLRRHRRDPDAGRLLDEASEIFERLGPSPWLDRIQGLALEAERQSA